MGGERFMTIQRPSAQKFFPIRGQNKVLVGKILPGSAVGASPLRYTVRSDLARLRTPTPRPIDRTAHRPAPPGANQKTPPTPNWPDPTARYEWPVDVAAPSRLTSHFGWRDDPFTGRRAFHAAIDIAAPLGTPVIATDAGRIHAVGFHPRLGRYVMLTMNDGTMATYGHLSATTVRTGQNVARGDIVGKIGSSGRSTGPHLDFSLETNGVRRDPLPLVRQPMTLAQNDRT